MVRASVLKGTGEEQEGEVAKAGTQGWGGREGTTGKRNLRFKKGAGGGSAKFAKTGGGPSSGHTVVDYKKTTRSKKASGD